MGKKIPRKRLTIQECKRASEGRSCYDDRFFVEMRECSKEQRHGSHERGINDIAGSEKKKDGQF